MIKVFTVEQNDQWDLVVRSFQYYDVYWLSGYVKAFRIHGDGEPLLIYFKNENLRGINVVMKRDISEDCRFQNIIEKNKYFDLVTPYGYGGWLIEGVGNSEQLFTAYEKWCENNNIVSEFVRYHPVLKNHEYSSDSYDIVPLGGTISMNLNSPETIWTNLTSKNRNMIRKAEKSGIKIYNGNYPEIYNNFIEIYNGTMDKDNADSYYYFKVDFYNSILNDLSNNAQVFYAVLNEEVIAASIILAANGRLNYHLSGSLKEYQNLAPSNLLLYKAALWGCANGCKTFHLGGGVGSCEDSLYKFKKAFYRGEPYKFHIGHKIFNQEKYKALIKLRCKEEIDNSGFFPKYRA